jgi:catechol 2,3-dioxygenase-like lactoylglutathione lyase family enzyme
MILGIDHTVILVDDLEQASDDYTRLGFTVMPGGEHADGATHNALITLKDGSYLELLAFLREAPEHRWWRHAALGQGFIDWALLPSAIEEDLDIARAQGVALTGPVAGGRTRPDGQRIEWQMGLPHDPELPFLCGDVTPRGLRVPEGASREHANGVLGIAGITIAVADIEASMARYRGLLNLSAQEEALQVAASDVVVPESGARIAVFPAGGASITLAQPAASSTAAEPDALERPLSSHLAQRGSGPYGITMRVGAGHSLGPLDPALTHTVRITLVHE